MTGPYCSSASRGSASAGTDERRSEPRLAAGGAVRMHLEGAPAVVIPARILDRSERGMRVHHMYAALSGGALMRIECGGVSRAARVIWNRIGGEGVESGLHLL